MYAFPVSLYYIKVFNMKNSGIRQQTFVGFERVCTMIYYFPHQTSNFRSNNHAAYNKTEAHVS